ncbi:MAG: ABC transporter substrate-binding protein [Anaerolineales bacterium]
MHRRWLFLLIVTLVLAPALVGCQQSSPQAVTIAMGFVPNVQFAPVYVALEKGYFAEAGLDVMLDYGSETDLLQRVGAGDLNYAIASGDQVVLARANGLPVRYVANWYRRFPVCVVSLAEAGIETPADLVGKTVGVPVLSGASYIGWLAFAEEVGLDSTSVNLQAIGYTQMASLTEKRVDAAVCYAMNEPVQLATAGTKINVFYLDEYTGLVSNGIITSDQVIADRPEEVRGVVTAFLKGLAYTNEHPDEAFDIVRKNIPEMDDETAALQRAVLDECIRFWQADRLGYSDPAMWAESVALMQRLGLVGEIEPTDLYSNEFIP